MDPFEDSGWDPIDYSSLIDDVVCTDPYWGNQDAAAPVDTSIGGPRLQEKECADKECPRKRGRSDSCDRVGSKACRERLRREKLNDRFSELSTTLEPGRPVTTDKLAILGDTIRVLNHLKAESEEYKAMNEKLLEEIKTLKLLFSFDIQDLAEKNELREEKLALKADKARIEQQLKAMTATTVSSPTFVPAHPAVYQPGPNKMPVFPGYGFVPMWQYLPKSARDTSQDHELSPPAA